MSASRGVEKERALAIQRTFASEPADFKRNMIGYNLIDACI